MVQPGKTPIRRRPLVKQGKILETLRGRIVDGTFEPGSRLPLRPELAQQFGVSRITLQRALDRLTQDGYIYARGKAGTFVAEYPPHLWQYAVVFPYAPTDNRWSRFWNALVDVSSHVQRNSKRRFEAYYGTEHPQESEDYHKLLRDIESRRLTGIIFATQTARFEGTPVMTTPGIPRVEMASACDHGIPIISVDSQGFFAKAADYLISKGKRRIAVLTNAAPSVEAMNSARNKENYEYLWMRIAQERSIITGPHWYQSTALECVYTAKNLMELMFYGDQKSRPDGLIITNDNLVPSALLGLVSAGVRVPVDLEVVAHCNFPTSDVPILPVKRLGFSADQIMSSSISVIDSQREGKAVPENTVMPAKFEDELY